MMTETKQKFALAIHGGAGAKLGEDYSIVEEHLEQLAEDGSSKLASGSTAVDIVEYIVRQLEISGLYVAGKGSAAASNGCVELDASIMDGATRNAGSVAAVPDLVYPISAARAVMEKSPSVMLAGEGAAAFAHDQGLESIVDPKNYYVLPPGVSEEDVSVQEMQHGTVGAVARDIHGDLAAATSTGGVFGKPAGRVGDTPIIGIGTWADEDIAISCTGTGEYFIRSGGALTVANRLKLAGDTLEQAMWNMLDDVKSLGGDGGLIAVTKSGEMAMVYNSDGMKRASISSEQSLFVSTFAPCR